MSGTWMALHPSEAVPGCWTHWVLPALLSAASHIIQTDLLGSRICSWWGVVLCMPSRSETQSKKLQRVI